jgi:predicted ATPase
VHPERRRATQVPPTLTGVLQARLDSLPAPEKVTLQEASVIGYVFWDRALVALDAQAQNTLPKLVQRELVLPRSDTAQLVQDELREYAFRHHIRIR